MKKHRLSLSKTCLFFHFFGNKGVEIEWDWASPVIEIFKFSLRWDRKTDHAGIHFSAALLWPNIRINLYDYRHWNYKTKSWDVYCTVCDHPMDGNSCTNEKCACYFREAE